MSGGRRLRTGFPPVGTVAHKIRIGNRDGWICGICDQPVDRTLSVYESVWAAVVDHIRPKCAGGNHEDENLQISHYICNEIKGRQHPWVKGKPNPLAIPSRVRAAPSRDTQLPLFDLPTAA